MTRPELIEVLSFVPGFTTDMLSGLPSERLVELYSDYFEGQDMIFVIFTLFMGLVLSYMTFVDYSNGRFIPATISGVLALAQFVIIAIELL